jgi:alkyldihydroxyacetonephosphate synthase
MTKTHAPAAAGDFPIELGPAAPVFPPIEFPDGPKAAQSLGLAPVIAVPDALIERLRGACTSVSTDSEQRSVASTDWWPLGMHWVRAGRVGGMAGVVARASTTKEVAAVVSICNEAQIPVTAAGGRSGCVGGSVPIFGGVSLDLCGLTGIVDVDDDSLVVDVRAGTFGDHFERDLRANHGLTLGHWPQSISLSTVGGWIACRGAGQLSNRYGKIEDMVVGLDVVLADGSIIKTGGAARSATGPDLSQVFLGSEGTLGVIVGSRLRVHPAPTHERRGAWGFPSFAAGLDACRRVLRRGATPAVLRLYDALESGWKFQIGDKHLVIALDEGDPVMVDASFRVLEEECKAAERLDDGLVEKWMHERNDVSAIPKSLEKGIVYDTIEITGSWGRLPAIYDEAVAALKKVPYTFGASSHQSHAYSDGACLYFTFAGIPPADGKEAYYNAAWDAATRAILAAGGNLSHHHGVGLNRARFMREALGPAFDSLVALKAALDPKGILNPGKLGLPTPFGEVQWP